MIDLLLDAPLDELAVLVVLILCAIALAALVLIGVHRRLVDLEHDEVRRHQAQMRALSPGGRR